MTQGEKKSDIKSKNLDKTRKPEDKKKDRRNKEDILTKVVIRRLPPSLNEATFVEQISPIPEHDYFRFVRADVTLGENAFSRAYINFQNQDDIIIFKEKFDGYIFVDAKGNEFSAIVEFAPFPKRPKKKQKKPDNKCGTIEQDSDYQKFLELLENPQVEPSLAPEIILDEIETKERELKANHGHLKLSTPLLDYIKKRKEDKRAAILKAREDRKKREQERRKQREEEKRRRREKEREKQRDRERQKQQERDRERKESSGKVMVLKNPEREKERRDSGSGDPRPRGKDNKSSYPDSRRKDPEYRHKDRDDGKDYGPGGDSKYKDVGARPKEYKGRDWDGEGRDRQRDRGARGKNSRRDAPRGSRTDRDADRDRDRDRNRDNGKSAGAGSRRSSDSDRSKGKYGKNDKDDTRDGKQEVTSSEKESSEKQSNRDKDHGNKHQDYRSRRDDRTDDRRDDRKSSGKGGRNEKPAEKTTPKAADKSIFDSPNPKSDSVDPESEIRESSQDNQCSTKEAKLAKAASEGGERSKIKDSEDSRLEDSQAESGQDVEDTARERAGRKMRYRDRPERAIYNPGQRAAIRRKEMEARSRSKDSPESSLSPEG